MSDTSQSQLNFTRRLMSRDPREVGKHLTSQVKQASGADSVTLLSASGTPLAQANGKGVVVPKADRRSARLSQAAAAFGRPAWVEFDGVSLTVVHYTRDNGLLDENADEPLDPALRDALLAYRTSSRARFVGIVPIVADSGVLALLVVEKLLSVPEDIEHLTTATDAAAKIASQPLDLALACAATPREAAPKAKAKPSKARGRVRTLLFLIVVGTLVALCFWPVDWKLKVEEGVLEPEIKYSVSHGYTGGLAKIKEVAPGITQGAHVERGQLLLRMETEQLSDRVLELQTQLNKAVGESARLRALIRNDRGQMTKSDIAADTETITSLEREAEVTQERLAVAQQMLDSLTVTAPISGTLVEPKRFDGLVGQSRPATEPLVVIANDGSDWVVMLHVQENYMGYIRDAQRTQGTDALRVDFYLRTDPNQIYTGEIMEIDPQAEKGKTGDNLARVRVKVRIDKTALQNLENGASVVGNVYVGKSSALWAWWGWRVRDYFREKLF